METQCNAARLTIAYDATEEEVQDTFALAAQEAVETGEAVYVQFEDGLHLQK